MYERGAIKTLGLADLMDGWYSSFHGLTNSE
jgi:hypothetical protein